VPYPHLHLSYPAEVEAVMVRRDARVKVRVIAAVQSRSTPSAAAILSDLSTGGCSLLADNQLGQKSDEIVVKFKAPINGIEQLLTLKGVVRGIQLDCALDDGRSRFAHGVQFIDHAPADQVALTAFVYQKLIEDELKL
jgi:c-di-GMP-binding flagellar brake protein YcgR